MTDSKAESFADTMESRVLLSEKAILAVADLEVLDNNTIAFLQEILCKLSKTIPL